jgi:hypothetical protein
VSLRKSKKKDLIVNKRLKNMVSNIQSMQGDNGQENSTSSKMQNSDNSLVVIPRRSGSGADRTLIYQQLSNYKSKFVRIIHSNKISRPPSSSNLTMQ